MKPPVSASVVVPTTIGFRLDAASRQVLGERAFRLKVSVHDLARDYVIEALQAQDVRFLLAQSLQGIEERLNLLRGDFATTTEAMLVNAGKIKAEEAHRWVEETFRTPC